MSILKFSREQFVTLVTLATCNFLSAIVFSLQAPFFPAEAERQGASTTFAGIVLGIYELAGFVACPLISSTVLRYLGSYNCFHLGVLTTGTTMLLFGFLNRINDTTTFIGLALLLRVLEAFGASATFVSSYGFLNVAFPDSIGTAFAVMETMFAVGMATGPPLGEALYELGMGSETWSFTAPFLTMGIVFYAATLFTSQSLRLMMSRVKKIQSGETENESETQEKGSNDACAVGKSETFTAFLRVPRIFVVYLSVVGVSLCLGFTTCTLEPHLRQFHLTPLQTGGMFLVFGGVYAFTAWIWGLICDRIEKPIGVTLIGCLLAITGFTFMGPSVIIPLKPSLIITGVSLASFGLSAGAIYVSAFIVMTIEAKSSGFPDTATMSGAISALWLSGMHLGSFLGPILGGYLFENYGFGVETMFLVVLMTIILTLLLSFGLKSRRSDPASRRTSEDLEKTEKTPLLTSENGEK